MPYLFGLVKISPDGQLSELIKFSANNRSGPWCSGQSFTKQLYC